MRCKLINSNAIQRIVISKFFRLKIVFRDACAGTDPQVVVTIFDNSTNVIFYQPLFLGHSLQDSFFLIIQGHSSAISPNPYTTGTVAYDARHIITE